MTQLRDSVRERLTDKIPQEKVEELAKLLSEGTWTHDHPITFEVAKSFGLPVRSDISAEFLDLLGLSPSTGTKAADRGVFAGKRHCQGSQGRDA